MRDRYHYVKWDLWSRWHLVILVYVCFIYGNSLTPSSISSQESGFLLVKLKGMMESIGWEHVWLTEHIIRKTAHFIEYAGLGCLCALAFRIWLAPVPVKLRNACELVFFIPFVDETIQLFVPGRSGQISDVWLDLCGAVCGMLLMAAVRRCLEVKKIRKQGKRKGRVYIK